MSQCPVCGNAHSVPVLEQSGVPVLQNAVMESRDAARSIARGDLQFVACTGCGFVWNRAFRGVTYDQQYDNTVPSAAFDAHVDSLVARLVADGVRGKRVAEVGCGQGDFLKRLVSAGQNTGIGFDPAYRGPAIEGPLRFVPDYFAPDPDVRDVDVAISRHVIEHIPDPLPFLASLRSLNAPLYLETPSVEWILERVEISDLFYEHCSLFSAHSLTIACHRAGFEVAEVTRVFGGQYLWLRAVPAGRVASLAREFRARYAWQRERWQAVVGNGTALWGAGAKGVTMAGIIDPTGEHIPCIVDNNPAKQGRYLPGTGHPIVAPATLSHLPVTSAVSLNPNYTQEIERQLDGLGLGHIRVRSP